MADLEASCSDELRRVAGPQDGAGRAFLDVGRHPSVSLNGTRAVTERYPPTNGVFELWIHDVTVAGVADWMLPAPPDGLGYSDPQQAGITLRPHLSGDGRFLFYTTVVSGTVATFWRHDIANNSRVEIFQLENIALASTQSATNDDGTQLVAVNSDGAIVRRTAATLSTGNPADVLAPANPVAAGCLDATMSGSPWPTTPTSSETDYRVAWVAPWDYCANSGAGAPLGDPDVWVWLPDASVVPTGYPPDRVCDSPMPGVEVLVRLGLPGINGVESSPAITRNGNRVFFVSTSDFWGDDGTGAPRLWYVDLASTDWSPKRVPLVIDLTEAADMASPNADGSLVAYSVQTSVTPGTDLRMVHVDAPGAVPLAMALSPPHLPFHLGMQDGSTSCVPVAGGIEVTAQLRAFGQQARTVLVTYEVTDGVTVDRSGPFVQELLPSALDDHAWAYDISSIVPSAIGAGTCSVVVTDAAEIQPDMVRASEAFQ